MIISALRGKGNLDLALRMAVTIDPEEILLLLKNYTEKEGYSLHAATFLNKMGVSYYDEGGFDNAEKSFQMALKICQGADQNSACTYEAVKALTNLGIIYSMTGRFSKAESSYRKALEMEENSRTLEGYTPASATILINLGNLYRDTQRFSEAEPVYSRALRIMRGLAEENPAFISDVALILANLGLLYWNVKRFSEAESAYKEAVRYWNLLSQNPEMYAENLAKTLNNMGILYENTQRFSEAEKIYQEALERCRSLENKNPESYLVAVADTLVNLGTLYWHTRKFDRAETMYRKALKLRRELCEKNPDVYTSDLVLILNNIGNLYSDTLEFDQAETMYEGALEKCRSLAEKSPVSSPSLAMVLNNMGILYKEMKGYDKAEKALNEALEIRRELLEKNPDAYTLDVAMTLNNLGLLYRTMGRFSEARKVYNEALEGYQCFAENSAFIPEIARTLNNLGTLYSDMQEFSEAEKVFVKALEMYRDLGRNEAYALDVAGALKNLGTFYRDTKRFDKAENVYNESLEMYRDLEKGNPEIYRPYVASILNDVGIFYQDTRRFYEAETAYKEALERRMDLFRENPELYAADYAGTLSNLGNLYNDLYVYEGAKRFSEAETMYRKALETFESLAEQYPEVFAPHVAGMLNNLGALYKDTDRFSEAEEVHKNALELRKELAGKNPEVFAREVGDSLTSLGAVYEGLERIGEAEKVYEEAFRMYKELALWFDAANTCYNLSQLKSDKVVLDQSRKLIEMAILFSRERKYVYAQKGKYEHIYWGLLDEDMSSFSVLEAMRDPELLSLPWKYILSNGDIERAQKDVDFQKNLVNKVLYESIPAITILEKFPESSLFIYVEELRDNVLFFVVGDYIQRFTCRKEFLKIGDELLRNLRIQQGAAGRVRDMTFVIEKFNDLSRKWSEMLPREIKRLIQDHDHILLSPGARCSYFPLEALPINGQPMCIGKTVVRFTSLHQFLALSRRNPLFDSSLILGNPWPECKKEKLIYAVPSGSSRFHISFLDGAQQEATTLMEKLPYSTVLLGQQAAGEKFLSEISQHSLIHFSGHGSLGRIMFFSGPFGRFPPQFEPEEFSDLRKAERHDGERRINMMEEWHPITDMDLYDVKLREGAIVFLNACETGQQRYAGGGYYQGLPAVFLKNGAHSVISSLVPVFDESSKNVALHFYETLLCTHSVPQSLRKARIWAKDTYKAQIYWIPYIHYGLPL